MAVEEVQHAYGVTPDKLIIATKDVESSLVTLAYAAGVPADRVMRITAVSWRRDLGISPPHTDEQIAIVVTWAYGDDALAGIADDARTHVYDALGLAMVALARRTGRRVVLPVAVGAAVYAARQAAVAAGKARKARKAAAEPVRAAIAAAGGTVVDVAALARATKMPMDAIVAALKVISKARALEAPQARAALVAAGARKPDKGAKGSATTMSCPCGGRVIAGCFVHADRCGRATGKRKGGGKRTAKWRKRW